VPSLRLGTHFPEAPLPSGLKSRRIDPAGREAGASGNGIPKRELGNEMSAASEAEEISRTRSLRLILLTSPLEGEGPGVRGTSSKELRVRLPAKKAPYVLLAALILIPLAAWVAAPGVFYANAYASNDAAVLRAALEHFAKHEQYLARHKEAKTSIVVNDQTEGAYPFDFPKGGRMAQSLSMVNYWNLRDRNGSRASLGDMSLGKAVVVVDLSNWPRLFGEFEKQAAKKFPGTAQACYAQLWLPGYSLGGATAFVTFRFGPSSHGAFASYLLKKQGDEWIVSDYDLAYYM
jgi:hypothetical protein